jgi:uncharacterized membrane protein YhaH (DUF805 family)
MNRPTYWLCYVLFMLIVSVLVFSGTPPKGGMELMMIFIGIPRLHDIGRSGWLVGIAIIGEIIVIFGALFAGASVDTLEITAGVVFLVIAALGIWLGLISGDAQANTWGEPPQPGIRFGRPLRQN